MMNKLIVIGYLGSKTAYLNVSKEEAIRRYCENQWDPYSNKTIEELVDEFDMRLYREFKFEDTFNVYDAW